MSQSEAPAKEPVDHEPKPPPRGGFLDRDDVAYIAPMLAFLLLISVGGWSDKLYPIAYAARTILAAALLAYFWKHYTKIRWNHWWLGIIVGVIGIFRWM